MNTVNEASNIYIDTLHTRYPRFNSNTSSINFDLCQRIQHAIHVLYTAYAAYELHAGVYRIQLSFADKLHFTRNQLEQVLNIFFIYFAFYIFHNTFYVLNIFIRYMNGLMNYHLTC